MASSKCRICQKNHESRINAEKIWTLKPVAGVILMDIQQNIMIREYLVSDKDKERYV